MTKVSDSTLNTFTISLDPAAYDPVKCSECGRVYANWTLWSQWRVHSCVVFASSYPINVRRAELS